MGFLSRKKPKPAPVEIQEEHPIVDELQEMEAAVPERSYEEPRVEIEEMPEPVVEEQPEPILEEEPEPVVEDEPALNAEEEESPEAEGDGRMKAIDLIAPTRLDFLAE